MSRFFKSSSGRQVEIIPAHQLPKSAEKLPRSRQRVECGDLSALSTERPLVVRYCAVAKSSIHSRFNLSSHHTTRIIHPIELHAMISVIGFPWSISRRLRPGISSLRELMPS